jgi:hypothetical protein
VIDWRQSYDLSESTHASGACVFLSSSVPEPGHRIVRFAKVVRRRCCGDGFVALNKCKDVGGMLPPELRTLT